MILWLISSAYKLYYRGSSLYIYTGPDLGLVRPQETVIVGLHRPIPQL